MSCDLFTSLAGFLVYVFFFFFLIDEKESFCLRRPFKKVCKVVNFRELGRQFVVLGVAKEFFLEMVMKERWRNTNNRN